MSSELDPHADAPVAAPSAAPGPSPSGPTLVRHSVWLYAGVLGVAVVWGLLDGCRGVYVAPGGTVWWRSGLGLLGGLGLGLFVVALSRLSTHLFAWARRLHQEFHGVLSGLTTTQALALALASSVGEEALFRGAMVPTMGIWWSSVLFGLAHFPVRRHLWPWPLMAFGMGLAFAGLYLHFGDLGAPIVAHATINFLNLGHISRESFASRAVPLPGPPSGPPSAPPLDG